MIDEVKAFLDGQLKNKIKSFLDNELSNEIKEFCKKQVENVEATQEKNDELQIDIAKLDSVNAELENQKKQAADLVKHAEQENPRRCAVYTDRQTDSYSGTYPRLGTYVCRVGSSLIPEHGHACVARGASR